MDFANVGTMGVLPGKRDEVIAILTRANPALAEIGCLVYEVGGRDDDPDTVYVTEIWESEEAHGKSLDLDTVQAAIAETMPLLSGDFGGYEFTVAGSPIRD